MNVYGQTADQLALHQLVFQQAQKQRAAINRPTDDHWARIANQMRLMRGSAAQPAYHLANQMRNMTSGDLMNPRWGGDKCTCVGEVEWCDACMEGMKTYRRRLDALCGAAVNCIVPPPLLGGLCAAIGDALAPTPAYGEQGPDTDGDAALQLADQADRTSVEHLKVAVAELGAERDGYIQRLNDRIAQLTAERDALRTELAQRMALPANALRHGR